MRNNTPVTNVEYDLKENAAIVSKTDTRGIITYVNSDFVEASGYSEKELIGQPHNLLRHPDMPAEAFADLWNCLKSNKPWTGLVKNRRKNGDFYWVVANVAPVYEKGSLAGYMSSRTKATREQISTHAAAYQLFKEKRQGTLKIKEGRAVNDGFLKKLNVVSGLNIRKLLIGLIAFMSATLLLIGMMGLIGLRSTMEESDTNYTNDLLPQQRLSDVSYLAQRNRILLMDTVINSAPENIKKRLKEFEQNTGKLNNAMDEFNKSATENSKSSVSKFIVALGNLLNDGYNPAAEALKISDTKNVARILEEKISPLNEPVKVSLKELNELYLQDFDAGDKAAENRFAKIKIAYIAIIAIGILLALLLGFFLIRRIDKELDYARKHISNIAQGQYFHKIEVTKDDEIGQLMYAMKSMQIRMGFEVTESHRMANEAMRVNVALDNVGTGVMISDSKLNIIYVNKSVVNLLTKAESDIRKVMPNFNVSKLLGSNIDQFHKVPTHQQQILTNLKGTHNAEISLAGHTFALSACPVINEKGEHLGYALEWRDRTTEVAVEKEVASLVEAASNGEFTGRICLKGKDGFFMELGTGINKLMETSSVGLDEVVRVLSALAKGDLTEKITNEYHGTFGQLKDDSNMTVEKLNEVIARIKEATDTINIASKEIASGNTDLSQRTEEQASSLEETAASMEELTSTVKQNAENAKQANQLASTASTVAEKGGAVVHEVVGTMSAINDSSRKIVDIISVIDGIAFQTNILALNAAVEAARAGEQGRGFAVVAAEVRNLAQRSAAAAKEIKTLIDDSVTKVEVGTRLVDDAGKTMEEIVNAVKRVTDIMSEISAASSEQSKGIEQVNQAITQMDEVTQQNAALVEEAAAAAESLEEEAQNLSRSVSVFKLAQGQQAAAAVVTRAVAKPAAHKPATAPARKAVATAKPKALPNKPVAKEGEEWEEF